MLRVAVDDADFPDWSPDGKHIAFDSSSHGAGFGGVIFVVDLDGSGLRKLRGTDYGSRPLWSPDGKYIAFEKADDPPTDVYVVAAKGGSARRLTHPLSTSHFDLGNTLDTWWCRTKFPPSHASVAAEHVVVPVDWRHEVQPHSDRCIATSASSWVSCCDRAQTFRTGIVEHARLDWAFDGEGSLALVLA